MSSTYLFMSFLDIDECGTANSPCDANAVCANTIGGYTCTCNSGYSGDGQTCTGKYLIGFMICFNFCDLINFVLCTPYGS